MSDLRKEIEKRVNQGIDIIAKIPYNKSLSDIEKIVGVE